MKQESPKYRYVNITNKYMFFAYRIAKALYLVNGWNQKTTPVAVIVNNGLAYSWAAAAHGLHALEGRCERSDKPGSPYSDCKWCVPSHHAERLALDFALKSYKKGTLKGASVYMYGHWHMCQDCVAVLRAAGIKDFVLLENSSELFDRHHENTVIGTPHQFSI